MTFRQLQRTNKDRQADERAGSWIFVRRRSKWKLDIGGQIQRSHGAVLVPDGLLIKLAVTTTWPVASDVTVLAHIVSAWSAAKTIDNCHCNLEREPSTVSNIWMSHDLILSNLDNRIFLFVVLLFSLYSLSCCPCHAKLKFRFIWN